MSLSSISLASIQTGKDDLPPEPLTDYYEARKNIIFKKLTIAKNEEYILNILKKSQSIVNTKTKNCSTGGFFQTLASTIFNLSVCFKENIANYCLVLSLYLNENKKLDALKLFLLMCSQNKKTIQYLSFKIIEQLPKISNTNKIAKFYPTITKTMLQIISVFIKLAGKFNKSMLESFYFEEYLKIVKVISVTVVKYINPGKIDEINNQLKNERKYFYSHCLFDCSLYLFNRYQPLSITISILQHILDLYNNNENYLLNEIEMTLLLKINFNLGLFLYSDGFINEAISNLNQAKERLSDIKHFPISKTKKSRISLNEEDLLKNKLRTNNNNSSNIILDFNDNEEQKINHNSRNKFKRSLNKSGTYIFNDRDSLDQQSTIFLIGSTENIKSQGKKHLKQYSTIYLGISNMMKFKNPIELDLVKEKILNEIELILAEIELKNKNYKESLNHLNFILNLQKNMTMENGMLTKESIRLIKNKTNSTQNDTEISEKKNNDKNRFLLCTRKNGNENNIFFLSCDKNINNIFKENLSSSNLNNLSSSMIKYHLTNNEKSRIMRMLEEIELSNYENDNNNSKNKIVFEEETNYNIDKNKNINRNQKDITSKEMEKFFIFICGLSIYQLKILNDTQPPPSRRRNNLPILFNNQFQDCLTNSQRMNLSLLETMSLSRYILLKDPNKDISLDNIDYRFMLYRIKDEESYEENNNNNLKKKKFKRTRNVNGINVRSKTYYLKGKKKLTKKYEIDEEDTELKFFLINNPGNKKLINSRKKSIIKFLEQINHREQKFFHKNPELLTKILVNTEKQIENKI